MERFLSSWHFPLQMMFHVMLARATAVFAQYAYRHVL